MNKQKLFTITNQTLAPLADNIINALRPRVPADVLETMRAQVEQQVSGALSKLKDLSPTQEKDEQ